MNIAYDYIRFSTPQQQWGDSERRQLVYAKRWLAAHPEVKASDKVFKDPGLSAYSGEHREKGCLTQLLSIMGKGDYLLVENSDRLSREDPLTAMNALQEIVKKGVTVVTLMDGKEINSDNFFELGNFLQEVVKAALANMESEKKSVRIKEAWDAKVELIRRGVPVMHLLPPWLKFEDGKFVVIEEKAKVVRQVFKFYLQGHGTLSIANMMKDVPHISSLPGRRRRKSLDPLYIFRFILKNKAVIGYIGGREGTRSCSLTINPPIPNYYPPIVEDRIFWSAQRMIETRANRRGRKSGAVHNLFTSLLKCKDCGNSLVVHHGWKGKKNTKKNFLCYGSRFGKCSYCIMGIADFERSFLELLSRKSEVRSYLQNKEGNGDEGSLLESLKGQLANAIATQKKIEKMIDGDDDPPKLLVTKLKQAEKDQAKLEKEIEVEELKENSRTPAVQSFDRFTEYFSPACVQDPQHRTLLRELIRGFVDRIDVKMGTTQYWVHFRDSKYGPIEWHTNYKFGEGEGDTAPIFPPHLRDQATLAA